MSIDAYLNDSVTIVTRTRSQGDLTESSESGVAAYVTQRRRRDLDGIGAVLKVEDIVVLKGSQTITEDDAIVYADKTRTIDRIETARKPYSTTAHHKVIVLK